MTTICSPNTDRIKCNPGDEIIIDDVFYGRRSQYYCNTDNTAFPNLPCVGGAGAGNQVRLYCDHQSQCIVEARLSWLNIPDPCPAVTKYLQVGSVRFVLLCVLYTVLSGYKTRLFTRLKLPES